MAVVVDVVVADFDVVVVAVDVGVAADVVDVVVEVTVVDVVVAAVGVLSSLNPKHCGYCCCCQL